MGCYRSLRFHIAHVGLSVRVLELRNPVVMYSLSVRDNLFNLRSKANFLELSLFGATKRKRSKGYNHVDTRVRETVTRTFRINAEWDEALQEEAENKGVSVNVLVNQILRRYALYTRWADKGNIMKVTKPMFHKILNELSEETLESLGEGSGLTDVLDILNMMGKPVNYDSLVYMISEHLGGNDLFRWFTCYHHIQGDKDLFHLQHSFGLGWSKFLNKYLKNSLKSLSKVEVESNIYPFAVNLLVKKPHGVS